MTEQEMYDALLRYFTEKADKIGCENVSFLIVAVGENDEHIQIGTTIVDVDMPETITGPPIDLTLIQQTVFYLKELIQPVIETARELAALIFLTTKVLGKDVVHGIAQQSANKEEFQEKLVEAVEKHGTG